MSASQEASRPPASDSSPAGAPVQGNLHGNPTQAGASQGKCDVSVPKPGDRFTDEDLRARYGVPLRGGIRVSRENRCIVLVGLPGSDCDNSGIGGTAYSFTVQSHYGDRTAGQRMEGSNDALRLLREKGCTVLHFAKEGGMLRFVDRVEYVSHRTEVRKDADGRERDVVVFNLRAARAGAAAPRRPAGRMSGESAYEMPSQGAAGPAGPASPAGRLRSGGQEGRAEPADKGGASVLAMVESLLAEELVVESPEDIKALLPSSVDARDIGAALFALVQSRKILLDGEAILWVYRDPGEFEKIYKGFTPL